MINLILKDGRIVESSFNKFTMDIQLHKDDIDTIELPSFTEEQVTKFKAKLAEIKFLADLMGVEIVVGDFDYVSGFGQKLTREQWNSSEYRLSRGVNPNKTKEWNELYDVFMDFRTKVDKLVGKGDDRTVYFTKTVWNYCQQPPKASRPKAIKWVEAKLAKENK